MADSSSPSEPELKYQRFKEFLLERAQTPEEKEVLMMTSFSMFMALVASFAVPMYAELYAFCTQPHRHTEEASHEWAREMSRQGGAALLAAHLLPYEEKASAADIVKCSRYLEYFSRVVFERFEMPDN